MSGARRSPRLAVVARLAIGALLLLPAAQLLAYTIFLKDGSHIVAREKYKVVGNRALIKLPNGTQTFLPADQIDVEKSEQSNQGRYGTAEVIEQGKVVQGARDEPAAKPTGIAALAAGRRATPPAPAAAPPPATAVATETHAPGRTAAGFPDFAGLAHEPFPQADLAAEIRQELQTDKVPEVTVYRGTQPDRVLLQITTNSESAIFRALLASAKMLQRMGERSPRKIAAVELILATATGERAGQFVITPELAGDLLGKRIELTAFYVQNVQF